MNLEPFQRIDPCGYAGLEVIDLARLGHPLRPADVAARLMPHLVRTLRLPQAPLWVEQPPYSA
jgi:lipoyl(octanoyl) transferase